MYIKEEKKRNANILLKLCLKQILSYIEKKQKANKVVKENRGCKFFEFFFLLFYDVKKF